MFFVFDVGGTKIRMGNSYDGINLGEVAIVQNPKKYDAAVAEMFSYISKNGGLEKEGTEVVLGLPGVLNHKKDCLISAPNLQEWVLKPIKKDLEKKLNSPVYLENDAGLAGLGEALAGAGRKYEIVAYIAIGTGIGGTRVVKGKIDPSKYGFEPGHQIIDINSGKITDFEGMVSGRGIFIQYGESAERIVDQAIWEKIETTLAFGLTNTILHWSPDVLVLGGGLMQSEFISIDRLEKNIKKILTVFPALPEIKKGHLGDKAGLVGGLSLLKDRH